jgi:hypothetical protein
MSPTHGIICSGGQRSEDARFSARSKIRLIVIERHVDLKFLSNRLANLSAAHLTEMVRNQKGRRGKTPEVGTTLGSHASRTGAGARRLRSTRRLPTVNRLPFWLYQTAHSESTGISGITRQVRKAEARAVSNPAQLFAATQFKLDGGGVGSGRE